MQSLLIAEDLHQGQFVQQGFKYENLPAQLLPVNAPREEITRALLAADVVFLLLHDLNLLDGLLSGVTLPYRSVPVIVLGQLHDPRLYDLVQNKTIHQFYLRPYPFRLMVNEVRNLIYLQREQHTYQVLRVRDLELNRDTHEVRWKGQSIHLRHQEFVLLDFLMLNAGKLLSRETILESVWDRNANIFTNTVDVHINKLRKKIDYTVSEKFIHTVHCSGYIFS